MFRNCFRIDNEQIIFIFVNHRFVVKKIEYHDYVINFRVVDAIREIHRKRQTKKTVVANKIRTRIDKKNQVWIKKVNEFDLKKFFKRRQKKQKTIQKKNMLFTFELVEMTMKKNVFISIIDVSTIFRFNKIKLFNDNISRCKLIDFEIFDYKNDIHKKMTVKNDDSKNWKIQNLQLTIKTINFRVINVYQNFKNFSLIE